MMSLLPAAAVALIAMATTMQLSAAAAAAPIGLPGCDTTCGNVSVPYPFGISPGCFWPGAGFNLTCDRSHDPPRLLLGDGTLRVIEIIFGGLAVRVVRTSGSIINTTGDFNSSQGSWNVPFGRGFTEYGYLLAEENELVVLGCNIVATLLADGTGEGNPPGRIGGCASLCTKSYSTDGSSGFAIDTGAVATVRNLECSGTSGCCKSPVTVSNPPVEVEAKRLFSKSDTVEEKQLPVNVFVAEKGWIDDNLNWSVRAGNIKEAPFLLLWSVKSDLPQVRHPQPGSQLSADDQGCRMLCKSENSVCYSDDYSGEGRRCRCDTGYQGNPYLPGGCQDIDECKQPTDWDCFGECMNTIGSMDCWCRHGTYGYPGFIEDGCVKINSTRDELLPTVAQAPIGLPDCSTTCGDVVVPYPFGLGPSRCYLPGFKLTCNTRFHPPRLFLDRDSTLQVTDIFLQESTVRIIHHTNTGKNNPITYLGRNSTVEASFLLPEIDEHYKLSTGNEFLLFAYTKAQATLYGQRYRNSSSNITGCSITNFSSGPFEENYRHCSGSDGCCHAPILAGSTPKIIEFMNRSLEQYPQPIWAFISEEGLADQWWSIILNRTDVQLLPMPSFYFSSPLVLRWAVKQGFQAPVASSSGQCSICKSKDSSCQQDNEGFTCHCNKGYWGNPYIADGCKDVDECSSNTTMRQCFGDCKNLPGKFKCQCQLLTFGNPLERNGCVGLSTILSTFIKKNKVGLSAASGPVLLLLVLSIMLVPRKIQEHKMKVLKQKYFKQNRGQLLQQLMSQNADIAERMIISMEELAKATNNFDQTRELGGGGHGTVYKGILSNQHVVAIKKSKITVQNEIDEFINEVAILSQVNHKNIVKLFGCCLETEVPLLVYEFISNGTLYQHLHVEGPRSLSWGNRLRIATEIASSLAYLHRAVSIPIIHRDIKSKNILLDDKMTSKISDFGASRYIPIDKTGLTTRGQGTIGYWDPMYFQTGRLTEKSDVYSFGVILVELLTRKKPFSYLTIEGDGLVSHFLELHADGNLVQIMDPQVIEEGGEEIQEVTALAASCINFRGEERPTMRQVAHTLEGLWGSEKYKRDDTVPAEFEDDSIVTNCPSTKGGQNCNESSTRYSFEQETMMSARYPQ